MEVRSGRRGLIRGCLVGVALGLAGGLLAGCQKQDEIRRYVVPKEERPPALADSDTQGTNLRLLAVIVPRPDHTWFFKLVGPPAQVAEHQGQWDGFLHSVHFTNEADPVTWTVPAGWRKGPAAEMRYATFLLGPEDAPLQATVFEFGPESHVLENVNRWRHNDLKLPPVTKAELPQFVKDIQVDGIPSTLVDMTAFDRGAGAKHG